jgi:predicted nucleic acid-binding protein
MKKYILDASVFLKAILNEEEKEYKLIEEIFSEVIRKKAIVYAPNFILLEFANGLRFSLNNESLSILLLEKFSQLPIEFFSFKANHIKEILKLAYRFQTTVYDTAYHFLAKLLDGVFFTSDKDYFKKAKNLGSIVLV